MPIMDPKKSAERHRISAFGGMQTNARLSPTGASGMRNLRILSDGSLEVRCGCRLHASLSGTVRGAWEGTIDGENYFFAVAGASVYRLAEDDTDQTPSPIFYLPSTTGSVTFIPYADRLYLADGISIFRFVPALGSFTSADGYTPLYGKNWSPGEKGSVYEPINLVRNSIRIHYLNATGERVFRLPYSCRQIDRLRVNGRIVTTYSFVRGETSFSIPEALAMEYGSVEVAVTLETVFDRRNNVLYGGLVAGYADPYRETLVFGGGSSGYRIYLTAPVSDEQLNACSLFYESPDPLYVREDMTFSVGSVQHPITAVLQADSQMLILNDRNLWALRYPSTDAEIPEILLLRMGIGCSSRGGALLCNGDIVTVQESGITRLTFRASDPDSFESETLSVPIADKLLGTPLTRASLFWRRSVSELWVFDPNDPDGTIWIYSAAAKSWYAYDSLFPSCLFEGFGTVGFGKSNGMICLMDESCHTDLSAPITAWYHSHYLEPNYPEAPRRIGRACVCADLNGGTLELTLESERCEQTLLFSEEEATDAPSLLDARLSIGRFRLLRYKFKLDGSERIRIHYISLLANN